MNNIRIEKLTLNIGAGKDQSRVEKGMKLLNNITNLKPIRTLAKKRIPSWGLRPGLPIGCKLTIRKNKAKEMLARLLHAKDNILKEKQFDEQGNISFGIPEYIDIKDAKYDPEIGIIGLEACVTLEKPGHRIKKRRIKKKKIPSRHQVKKKEAVEFMKKEFNVKISEE